MSDDLRWALALAAIDVLIEGGDRLGGIVLRAKAGPVRDAWLGELHCVFQIRHSRESGNPDILPATTAYRSSPLGSRLRGNDGRRVHRLPASADLAALDGGLDLTATLAAGRPIQRTGLLADAAGGVLLVPMAERLAPGIAARLTAVADAGGVTLVLLDEGEGDEGVAVALAERMAMWVDLGEVRLGLAALLSHRHSRASGNPGSRRETQAPRSDPLGSRLRGNDDVGAIAASFTAAAITLGIASVRAPLHALRVARASAALAGRDGLEEDDIELAAALVLGPRATQFPADEADAPPPEPPPPDNAPNPDGDPDTDQLSDQTDILLDAAKTALPPGLLEALTSGQAKRVPQRGSGQGAKLRSLTHGRPAGVRPGVPSRGARLALIETIIAAAPWQRLRQASASGEGRAGAERPRLQIRRDDLRVRRFVARAQATTVFAVDASGSAAIARLAEAKGAVELLLAQAYVKRAEVALVSFRGDGAELLLPPTRSLARAKRSLAELAGGGGTPLAAGLDMARRVAETEAAKGRTPLVVVLTDGRANIGQGDPPNDPHAEALAAGKAYGALKSVFIDTGKRPRAEAAAIATAMGARYVALPRFDARDVVAIVETA